MEGVVANELVGSVDDHLRGVYPINTKACAVLALPLRVLMGGEAVVPTKIVPVVDMLAEDDDLGVLNWLIVVKLREEGIGGWATGAAFGREEFYEDWRAICVSGLCVARSEGVEEKECGNGREES